MKFKEDAEREQEGLPKICYEDIIIFLCGKNYSPEHENKIKQMKLSKFTIILINKEKEEFRMWIEKKDTHK